MIWESPTGWQNGPIVGIDFETTGLEADTDRIVSFGLARIEDGAVVLTLTGLVNPHLDTGIPPFITEINGIASADIEGCPDWAAYHDQIARFTEGALIAAHRLPFDARFWRAECERMGVSPPARRGVCTKVLACAAGIANTHLEYAISVCGLESALAGGLGIPVESLHWHDALHDAAASALLAGWLLDSEGPLGGPQDGLAAHERYLSSYDLLWKVMRPSADDLTAYGALGNPPWSPTKEHRR